MKRLIIVLLMVIWLAGCYCPPIDPPPLGSTTTPYYPTQPPP